jgi:hypothetical protein
VNNPKGGLVSSKQNERIRKAARAYITAGYAVSAVDLILDEGGKKVPKFRGSWNNSITDLDQVDEVFEHSTGIAISTDASGIVVVDVDVSGDKDGVGNLASAGISLPGTGMHTETWSGGEHLFFRQPAEPVGTGANTPVKDVDYRGTGGVVFAAPSVVLDFWGGVAGTYELTAGLLSVDELPVLPEDFAVRLRAKPVKEHEKAEHVDPVLLRDDQREVIEAFIRADEQAIAAAVPGQRNETLGRHVFQMAHRAQQLGMEFPEYRDRVLAAYLLSGGSDEDQALNHAESSWRSAAEGAPWGLPETPIDKEADKIYARLIASRLAQSRINGQTSRLLTDSSFVDWSIEPPEPEYWVNGVIPKGEQVVLYGMPEAGKTFLALDWALSIVTGQKTFGHGVTKGRVLYMSGEGNARITSRMHAWIQHHGNEPEPGMLLLTNHVPDLMNDHVIENLARQVAAREIDVVIIDTLGRAMAVGGGDISSPPDTAQALKNMQAISAYRPTATPIVIHHPIKSGGMAGAYNLLAGVDVALKAEVQEGTNEGILAFEKRKDGVKGEVCSYQWKATGRSAVLVPVGGMSNNPFEKR